MSTIREPRPMKPPEMIDLRIEVTQCPDCKHPEPGRHHYPCPPEMEAAMIREHDPTCPDCGRRDTEWTPGPWERTNLTVHTKGTQERGCLRIARVYESGVETDAAGTPEQTTANANLIAAAPQMAEALREMDANCENRQDEPFVKYVRQTCRAALRAAGVEP